MLDERRVLGLSYDKASDTLSVRVDGDHGRTGARQAQLLVDEAGRLVGVDLEGTTDRIVVMAGPHEAVVRTVPTRVEVTSQGAVLVRDAKRSVRGDEPNPYV
jgi:hypothetical protein